MSLSRGEPEHGAAMSDEKALLGAIWAEPHEDMPRLVYADWLQETGEPPGVARAEFIRLQCEHARLDPDDPRRDELSKQADVVRKRYGGKWKAGLPRACRSASYVRGFPFPGKTVRVFQWHREQ